MKIMFLGADHEVTGSCHYMELCGKNFFSRLWYGAGKGYLSKSGNSSKASRT